jgi:hypothetical protein
VAHLELLCSKPNATQGQKSMVKVISIPIGKCYVSQCSALKHQVNVQFNRNVVPRCHLEKREDYSDALDQSAFTSFLMLSLQPMLLQRPSEICLQVNQRKQISFFSVNANHSGVNRVYISDELFDSSTGNIFHV